MKKAVVIGLLAVGALYVYKKTPVGSYICTWWNRNCPNGELVSRDFQLDRVETLIKKLDDRRKALLHPIAEQEDDIEQLEQRLLADQEKLNGRRDGLRDLLQAVEAGTQTISFGGKTLTRAEAKARLDRANSEVELLRLGQEELTAKKELLQKDLAELDDLARRVQHYRTRLAKLKNQERNLQARDNARPAAVGGLSDLERDIQQTLARAEKGQRIATRVADLDQRTSQPAASGSRGAQPQDHRALKDFVGTPAQPKVAAGN